jgi:hypothetical protein
MRNTDPEPEICHRDTTRLLEDLCLALRDVGVGDYGLLNDKLDDNIAVAAIVEVRELSNELQRRRIDPSGRLEQLTEETGWLMAVLLEDCLAWPARVPYVRDRDGIRRVFRCPLCQREEIPDRKGIWLGTSCLQRAAEAMADRETIEGLILYRTYNPEFRCSHADADTLVAVLYDEYDQSLRESFCKKCITEELSRRAKADS